MLASALDAATLTACLECLALPAALWERGADGEWRRLAANHRLPGMAPEPGGGAGRALSRRLDLCARERQAVEDVVAVAGRPRRHLRRSLVPVVDSGGPVRRVLMTLTDVTDEVAREATLAESEQRFRAFTEAASDGLWETGPDLRFVWFRARPGDRPLLPAATQFGLTPDEVVGRSGAVPDDPRSLAEIMTAREPIVGYVYRQDRPEGPVWRRMDGAPYYHPDGRFRGYRGVVRDITESRWQLAVVDEARRQAEQANRAKSRFLAAATHDLRQPLQAAIMFHAVLQRQALPPESIDGLDKLGRSLIALQDMLTRLLDISRLDAGVIVPSRMSFPLGPLVDRLADTYGPIAADRGLSLRVVPTGATVYSDPHLLDRILENLVSNAVKYTRTGRILVGSRRRGRVLSIRVIDTGIGIPEAEQATVFEEFRRGGNAPGDVAEGLGIGLAIVERLARLLEHPVSLRSVPGRGTMVEVRVPLEAAVDPDGPGLGAVAAPAPVPPGAGTVLVVENDPAVLESLALALESAGWRALTAADAHQALVRAAEVEGRLDAVIADIGLGGSLDGIDVVQAIRARTGHRVPALLLTGDTSPDRLRTIAGRGLSVLHKPVMPDTLGDILARMTGRS